MDIRLKNRHKLGVFLILLSVFLAALTVTFGYTRLEREKKWMEGNEESPLSYKDMENFCSQLLHWPYVLWMEEKESEAGKVLTPSQVFAHGLLERVSSHTKDAESADGDVDFSYELGESGGEYTLNLDGTEMEVYVEGEAYSFEEELVQYRQMLDETVRLWQSNLREWQPLIFYEVLDEQGKYILGSTGYQDKEELPSEWMQVEMHYNKQGVLDGIVIQSSEGEWENENKQELLKAVERYLTDFYYVELLQDSMEENLSQYGISISAPTERNYCFRIPLTALQNKKESSPIYNNAFVYMGNAQFFMWIAVPALLILVVALLLQRIPSLDLGRGEISRLPFESSLIGLVCLLPLGYEFGATLASVIGDGSLQEYLALNFAWQAATTEKVALFLYFGYWFLVFLLGYWFLHCLGAMFGMGFVSYWKKRSLVGHGFCAIRSLWRRFLAELHAVNLEQNSTKLILKIVLLNFVVLMLISCLWMFGIVVLVCYSVLLFFGLLRWRDRLCGQYKVLLQATKRMAEGTLDTEITEDVGMFESMKEELNKVQSGFKKAVEEETRSQRMKTELITNVSHDLKTPLTAIVTYINLLKQEDITQEERASYVAVLDNKAMRLKTLIEDLFEVSKAASRNLSLNLVEVDIVDLLKQVRLELSDCLEQSGVSFRWELPDEKLVLLLDSEKTYRIFENLLVNISKYALKGSRAYIEVREEEGANPEEKHAWITMKNISAEEISIPPQELTERFVRADASRNTEGSGLGLAIAKNFVEAQGGSLEIEVEADLFKVSIHL